jgi:hypothetical protein
LSLGTGSPSVEKGAHHAPARKKSNCFLAPIGGFFEQVFAPDLASGAGFGILALA